MRPWLADEYLNKVWHEFIWAPSSIVQTIERSHVFKKWLEQAVSKTASTVWLEMSLRSLRAAKHRFESSQKPAGRFILCLEPIITIAHRMAQERRGSEPGKRAASFLLGLSEEKLVQLALMADAGDEAMILTRGVDTESADPAIFPQDIERFLARAKALFVAGAVFQTQGYTKYIIDLLEHRNFSLAVNGVAVGVGGRTINANLKERCLARLQKWVLVAEKVCQAEFPSYELVSAFNVFDVTGCGVPHSVLPTELDTPTKTSLRRLSKVYGLDPDQLEAEYADHFPVAAARWQPGGKSNLESWRVAITHARRSVAKNHPTQVLRTVLQNYAASSISTSGVEQTWSRGVWLLGQGRGHARQHTESCLIKVVTDYKIKERNQVINLARTIWAANYPRPRNGCSGVPKFTKGVKRPRQAGMPVNSEASFIQKRRASVQVEAARVACPTSCAPRLSSGLVKEVQFQADKEMMHKVRALEDGLLLDHEITPAVTRAREKLRVRAAKAKKARARKHARWAVAQSVKRFDPTPFNGKQVFVEDGLLSFDVRRGFLEHRAVPTGDWRHASLFIVQNPGQAGMRARWAAALRGHSLITPRVWLTGMGPTIRYVGAMRRCRPHRVVWVSADFRRAHPGIWTIMQHCCTTCTGRPWDWLDSKDAFLHARRATKNKSGVLALVSVREFADPFLLLLLPLCRLFVRFVGMIGTCVLQMPTFLRCFQDLQEQGGRHVFTVHTFLKFVSPVNEAQCTMGPSSSVPSSSRVACPSAPGVACPSARS